MPRECVGWILSGALLGAVIVLMVGRVTNTTPAAPTLAPTATPPYGTITSYSSGGSIADLPSIEVEGYGDAVFIADTIHSEFGNFICGASVTGNADEFGDALFAVWVHGSRSSQLLWSEIAEETETVPVLVRFDRDHRPGAGSTTIPPQG